MLLACVVMIDLASYVIIVSGPRQAYESAEREIYDREAIARVKPSNIENSYCKD